MKLFFHRRRPRTFLVKAPSAFSLHTLLLLLLLLLFGGNISVANILYSSSEASRAKNIDLKPNSNGDSGADYTLDILMPRVRPTKHDQYVCTSKVVDPERESYIVNLEAKAEAKRAHHILLFGCSSLSPGQSELDSWECNEGNVCSGMKILFAWAKNAPPTHLPKDVGFKIGGDSGISYLVLQVHYAVALTETDSSGLSLQITYKPQRYLAGIFLLVSMFSAIPPHKERVHSDVNCVYGSRAPLHVFAYRVHAHSMGVVISGYKVSANDKSWTLLGKGNPQWPQAFYPMDEVVTVEKGDILASRCLFNSSLRSRTTYMGSSANDEMCNFYMMYYSDSGERLILDTCYDVLYPGLVSKMPAFANEPLPPNPLLEEHAMGMGHISSSISNEKTISISAPPSDHLSSSSDLPSTFDSSQMSVYKKGHGMGVDYSEYDGSGRTHYGTDAKGSDSSSGDSSYYDVNRGQVHHHMTEDEEQNLPSTSSSSLQGIMPSASTAAREKMMSWFSSVAIGVNDGLYNDVPGWPSLQQQLGQVTSLAFDSKGNIVIFHRGSKVWGFSTFDLKNRYTEVDSGPIDVDTVLTLDKDNGRLLHSWGKNLFYMPHGLFLDANDNVWVTDVAMHQVFKFGSDGSTTPLMTLGVRFEPDDDNTHFCKPSSVAVTKNGEFFVADGYCNNRMLKYSAEGELLLQWGRRTNSLLGFKLGVPPAYAFDIPHSLALAEDKGLILVADRENGRIQCFYTKNGTFHSQIQDPEFGGRLFGVSYSPSDGGTIFAVNGPSIGIRRVGVKGFVIHLDSRETVGYFTPSDKAMSNPHDVISTHDGQYVYVAEIGPNRVWKYVKAEHAESKKLHDVSPTLPPPIKHVDLTSTTQQTVAIVQVDKLPEIGEDNKAVKEMGRQETARLTADTNFTTSMIIMSLLAIPLLCMVFITVFVRLKKQGKFHGCNISHVKGWMTGYKNPNSDRFGIGNLLNNRHKGFDRVSMEDSDVDPEGSDSDVEEFSASNARKA